MKPTEWTDRSPLRWWTERRVQDSWLQPHPRSWLAANMSGCPTSRGSLRTQQGDTHSRCFIKKQRAQSILPQSHHHLTVKISPLVRASYTRLKKSKNTCMFTAKIETFFTTKFDWRSMKFQRETWAVQKNCANAFTELIDWQWTYLVALRYGFLTTGEHFNDP